MNLKELQKKYNLSDLELFTQDISTHKLSFVANKLKQTESVQSKGHAVRIVKDKRIGFASNFGKCDIDELVLQAFDVSKYSPIVNLEFSGNAQIVDVKKSKNSDCLSLFKNKGEEIIEKILSDIEALHATPLVDISFDVENVNENINNSKDLNYSNSKTIYSFSVNIRETLEDDFIDIYTAVVDSDLLASLDARHRRGSPKATSRSGPDYKTYVNDLVRFYKLSKKHARIKNGPFPVLFTGKAAKELIDIVETALSGKQVIEKSSPWHNKMGKQVLSKLITIKQDPKFGYMARSIDDEGTVVQPLVLINNGILENFYFDLLSACRGMLQHAPTGNGFKPSLTSPPEPSLLNVIVSAGDKSLDEIIKNVDYGLLIDQTMGGLTTNISGDISVNVDIGFLIEKGELVGRVKDTMVSGNVYTALNNVLELSNDRRWYWSQIYNPDMLLGGFHVTAK